MTNHHLQKECAAARVKWLIQKDIPCKLVAVQRVVQPLLFVCQVNM